MAMTINEGAYAERIEIAPHSKIATCETCGWTRLIQPNITGLEKLTLKGVFDYPDAGCPICIAGTTPTSARKLPNR